MMHAGIQDCAAFSRYPRVVSDLWSLDLVFPASNGPYASAEAKGSHIGEHLAQAVHSIPCLEHLDINFHCSQLASIGAMQRLTLARPFPRLRSLIITETNAHYGDSITFIVKHKATLEYFELHELHLDSPSFTTICEGFYRLLQCTKLAQMQFFHAYVVSRADRVAKKLTMPTCRVFYDNPQNEMWYGYGSYPENEEGGDSDAKIEGWMAIDEGADIYTIGSQDFVRKFLIDLTECFGGQPWAS